ncbi:MAG: LysR family transcriptional regulator [Burkholderiaceae bacterium]
MLDWENLRYVLAISRAQTLLSAADLMGVYQTTVGRRLGIVEESLGARLFDRVEQRLVPTVAGLAAIRRAERMEVEAQKAALEVAGRDKSLEGVVRLTSLAVVTNYF